VKPLFVREIRENDRVIETRKKEVLNSVICSKPTLAIIKQMLDDVVNCSDGTGKPAHSDKVRIAGKTGTAKLWNVKNKRYEPGEYQVSFCGYFPSDEPQYSMIVVIRNPRNEAASGGRMCGAVFKTVAEEMYSRNFIANARPLPVDTVHKASPVIKKSLKDLELKAGLVPDVKGMGAKAAVYAMENAGLRVNLTGRGTVIAQSLAPGSKVEKGQTVGLQLR
jgi:cell division protein FtsI (penicillin-binding protein 3)